MDLCAMTRGRRTRPFKQDQLLSPPVVLAILHLNQFPVNFIIFALAENVAWLATSRNQ